MDNVVPLLSFGAFSLLWAYLLKGFTQPLLVRLRNSSVILIPFGVGLFDIVENLCFVSAIQIAPSPNALLALQVGLIFVQFKAICLYATFLTTPLLIIIRVIGATRRMIQQRIMRSA